ncbi:uncharacterized protein HD556DRAFT_1444857 [Suillus plorans]|uniref:Uncharacterized protein n=1 Tax=Suillus plorans TaxID=116603 RepID=A0A9P7AM65_9AGAM|nr:uncharacterized protein HD556DRAFT_1444857 [Suillus plorans]KAG1792077.1 hypothetical protein HD556DRAFT_1444857 [Suillus plorans]
MEKEEDWKRQEEEQKCQEEERKHQEKLKKIERATMWREAEEKRNQRKFSLAITLIGNPSDVFIDEFSTGIDAKMKRDM